MKTLLLAQAGDPGTWAWWLRTPWPVVAAALLGSLVGSFLNVVIARLPRGISIVRPGSHCLACGHPIAWYDNIPILSYFLLRGRCRHCRTPISVRYAIVELLGAALCVATFVHTANPDPWIHLPRFLAEFAFVCFLVAVAFIDLDTWIIPNRLTYPALPFFAALAVLTERRDWVDVLAGAAAGFAVLALVIVAYRALTGKEGMGWGDAKLLSVLGAFLGWQSLPLLLFLAAAQGLVAAVVLVVAGAMPEGPARPYVGISDQDDSEGPGRSDTERPVEPAPTQPSGGGAPDTQADRATGTLAADQGQGEAADPGTGRSWRTAPLPFGPFLALAGIEALFFAPRVWSLMASW